ncbi:hypothetical protein ACLOJK_012625 [Asimina triloba]
MDVGGTSKSFIRECESMRNVRHRNLVKVISACSSNAFKALVFQFMPNGSLEDWLHKTENLDGENDKSFDLRQRLGTAVGIADALEYLHHDCETPIVHCDLKPSNVLLDEDLTEVEMTEAGFESRAPAASLEHGEANVAVAEKIEAAMNNDGEVNTIQPAIPLSPIIVKGSQKTLTVSYHPTTPPTQPPPTAPHLHNKQPTSPCLHSAIHPPMDLHIKTPTTQNLLLSLLLFLLFLSLLPPSASLNSTTDNLSLLHFKSSITADPFQVLDSWTPNTTFCNWTGIACGPAHGRVVSITLPNLLLSGTLSPHIANLSFLRDLDLTNNTFQGQLPTEFGNLSRLENLWLPWNGFTGTIPSSLSACSELLYLDLSDNRLEGPMPPEFGALQKLQILNLATNRLTGPIPSSFGNMSSLDNLILLENNLNGSIPEELGRLQLLLNLQFSSNSLTGEIPPSFFNLSSLMEFKVANNRLTGTLPPDMFFILPNLEVFLVPINAFSGPIPSSLSNASLLRQADFSQNNFSGQIPLLHNLSSIEKLNFEFNELVSDGPGGLDFFTSLSNSPRLEIFSVGTNRLTGRLPASIANLSRTLTMLEMEYNQLEGSLPAEIGDFVNLTHLSVRYNKLTGNIPSTIGNLGNLARLWLQGNSFNGSIPESLGNLARLNDLSLKENQLTGTIPSSLANCRGLQTLELSGNKLQGSIPGEIFDLPSLSKVLNLSHNSLSGSLPAEVGSLQTVQTIDISSNQLSGRIPATIGNCRSLVDLDMAANSFEGPIPSSVGDLKGLVTIDLSSNNLSGPIPTSLDSLEALKFLNLSMNELQGEVPEGGVFRFSTSVSLAGNAELCGGIASFGLPNCKGTQNKRSSSKVKLIIGVVAGALAFCFLCGVLLLYCKLGRRKSDDSSTPNVISFDGPHALYTYYDLRSATDNFSSRNLVGEGSFGSVYRGALHDGSFIAVKVFKMDVGGASKSFIRECESMRNVRHRNLVKIISACSSNAFKALVFQFMPNGSLEDWLHKTENLDGENDKSFDLRQRLEIAVGIADALEYLHHDCETPIVHCDLKPSNVLLDEDLNAHVGDFGLAKMVLDDAITNQLLTSTMELKGSSGYIPPEYGMQSGVSKKGDVYSYGILLLELFTRKRATDEMFTGELTLRRWVAAALPDRVIEIIDPEIINKEQKWPEERLVFLMRLGLHCSVDSPAERPTMRNVSVMIKAARDKVRYVNRSIAPRTL